MGNLLRILSLCLLVFGSVASVACGGDDTPAPAAMPPDDEDAGGNECIDNDRDGYGRRCSKGSDCDDNDPNKTDECRRCALPNENCPCKPGTEQQRCDPPPQKVDGGTLVCSEGTRYCREGYWSSCEVIIQYVRFVPD